MRVYARARTHTFACVRVACEWRRLFSAYLIRFYAFSIKLHLHKTETFHVTSIFQKSSESIQE